MTTRVPVAEGLEVEMPDILAVAILTSGVVSIVVSTILEWIRGRDRRNKVLASLLAHARTLPNLNQQNKTATDDLANPPPHLLPIAYPVVPFEQALFAPDGITLSDHALSAVSQYLDQARVLNATINALQMWHFEPDHASDKEKVVARKFINDQARGKEQGSMFHKVEHLKVALEREQTGLKDRVLMPLLQKRLR